MLLQPHSRCKPICSHCQFSVEKCFLNFSIKIIMRIILVLWHAFYPYVMITKIQRLSLRTLNSNTIIRIIIIFWNYFALITISTHNMIKNIITVINWQIHFCWYGSAFVTFSKLKSSLPSAVRWYNWKRKDFSSRVWCQQIE